MSTTLSGQSDSEVHSLSDHEAEDYFDKQVQSILGITAKEFLVRREKGAYKDACDNPRVLKLLMMVPKSLTSK